MNNLVCIVCLILKVGMAADPGELCPPCWSPTAPTMSGGSLGNPHAAGRHAVHPWGPRVCPLVRVGNIR